MIQTQVIGLQSPLNTTLNDVIAFTIKCFFFKKFRSFSKKKSIVRNFSVSYYFLIRRVICTWLEKPNGSERYKMKMRVSLDPHCPIPKGNYY